MKWQTTRDISLSCSSHVWQLMFSFQPQDRYLRQHWKVLTFTCLVLLTLASTAAPLAASSLLTGSVRQQKSWRTPVCRSSRDLTQAPTKTLRCGEAESTLYPKPAQKGYLSSKSVWQVTRRHAIFSANTVATNPGILLNAPLHDTGLTGLLPFTSPEQGVGVKATPILKRPSDNKYQPPFTRADPSSRIRACSVALGKSHHWFFPPMEAGRKLKLRGVSTDLAAFTSKIHCTNYLHCKQQLLLAENTRGSYLGTFSLEVMLLFQHFCPALSTLKFPSSQVCSQMRMRQMPSASQRSEVLQQVSWEERPPSQGSTRQSRTQSETEHLESAPCKQCSIFWQQTFTTRILVKCNLHNQENNKMCKSWQV